jgi:hypothetical protein
VNARTIQTVQLGFAVYAMRCDVDEPFRNLECRYLSERVGEMSGDLRSCHLLYEYRSELHSREDIGQGHDLGGFRLVALWSDERWYGELLRFDMRRVEDGRFLIVVIW